MIRLFLPLFVTAFAVSPLPSQSRLDFVVDPVASDVQLTIQLVVGGASDTDGPKAVELTGDSDARVKFEREAALGPYVTSVRPGANRVFASDTTFDLVIVNFLPIFFTIEGTGLSGSLSNDRWFAAPPTAQGTTELTTVDGTFTFDQGILQVTSSLGVNETVDLSVEPLTFPITEAATMVAVLDGSWLDLRLDVPLDQTTTITQTGITANVTITGSLVLRGSTSLLTKGAPLPVLLP